VLITHGESGRPVAPGSDAPATSWRQRASPASSSSPMGRWRRRLCSRFRIALHEDLWPDTRDAGDGLGCAARIGGEEPARHLQDADHGRGRTEFAHDRLHVPATAVLPRDRGRRRSDPGIGRGAYATTALEFPCQVSDHPQTWRGLPAHRVGNPGRGARGGSRWDQSGLAVH
jgi:hypothetical protein